MAAGEATTASSPVVEGAPARTEMSRRGLDAAFAAFDEEMAALREKKEAAQATREAAREAAPSPKPQIIDFGDGPDSFDREVDAEIERLLRQELGAPDGAEEDAGKSGVQPAPGQNEPYVLASSATAPEDDASDRREPQRRDGELEILDEDQFDQDVDHEAFVLSLNEELRADTAFTEEDEATLGARQRWRRTGIALSSVGMAAAVMIAVMSMTGQPQAPGGGDARLADAAGPAAAVADGDARRAEERGAIETASLNQDYLNRDEMLTLLHQTPIKCVLPSPDGRPAGAKVLDAVLAAGRAVCSERTDYRPQTSLFTRNHRIVGDTVMEINAPFSVEGDALCHHVRGLSALVIGGDVPLKEAVARERLIKTKYAAIPGGRICYRFREAFRSGGLVAYEADAFINGLRDARRSDPRPFLMRPRG